jgi:GH24 family phage-related lysozyme (muramidase)
MEFREWLQSEAKTWDYLKGFGMGAGLGAAALAMPRRAHAPAPAPVPVPAPSTLATPAPTHRPAAPKASAGLDMRALGDYIAASEGFRQKAYLDGRGLPTIGIGHLFKAESPQIFRQLFGTKYNFEAVKSGRVPLERRDVYALFDYDAKQHLARVRRVIPRFDTFPRPVKLALADAVYRGDLGKTTANLINQGRWRDAAQQYLNRRDYRNRHALGISGIGPRMERNQKAMLGYAAEVERQSSGAGSDLSSRR